MKKLFLLLGLVLLLLSSFAIAQIPQPDFWADLKSDYDDKTGNYSTSSSNPPSCSGSSCAFDGINEYVNTTLKSTTELTFGCWVNSADWHSSGTNFKFAFGSSTTTPGTNAFGIYSWVSNPADLVGQIRTGGVPTSYTAIDTTPAVDEWHLYVLRYNKTGSQVCLFYDTDKTCTATASDNLAMDSTIDIGGLTDGNFYFNGSLTNCFAYFDSSNIGDDALEEIYNAGETSTYFDLFLRESNLNLLNQYNDNFINNFTAEISSYQDFNSSPEGLVLNLHLDQNSATQEDSSGNGNDGTVSGATVTSDGRFGRAYDFDGVDDYINLDTCDNNNFCLQNISISCWFKTSDLGTTKEQSLCANIGSRFYLGINVDETGTSCSTDDVCGIYYNGTDFRDVDAGIILSEDVWYNVVYTRDQNTNLVSLYIDGDLKDTSTMIGDIEYLTSRDVRIGNNNFNTNNFNGTIDEVRVYNRSLSQDEISALYRMQSNYIQFKYNESTINNTIVLPFNKTLNISVFNISQNTYFNRSINNFLSNTSINLSSYQSKVQFVAKEIISNSSISSFNLTIGSFTNTTTTGTLDTYLDANTYSLEGESTGYNYLVPKNYTAVAFTSSSDTVYFANILFNITAYDVNDSTQINSFWTEIYQGNTLVLNQSTTNGNNEIYLPSGTYNISVKAEDYLYNYTFEKSASENLVLNLSSVFNRLEFLNENSELPIEGATITITYPDTNTEVLTTNSSGRVLFRSDTYGEQVGNYTITFEYPAGFISPVTFTRQINRSTPPLNEIFEMSVTNINVNIYDRETGELLNKTVEINILNLINDTTDNGTIMFQNTSIAIGEYVIQAISDGYATEQLTFDYTGQENVTINFYLLNLTGSNTGTLFANVIDEFYRIIQDARIELMQYDESTKSFIKVSECQSNTNGECAFFIELNVKTYYLKASKTIDGSFFSTESNQEIIKTDEETRQLFLRLTSVFEQLTVDNLVATINETFLNNISTIYLSFSTVDNSAVEVCVEYFRVFPNYRTSVYKQCVESSSSYSSTPVLLNRTFDYEALVYINNPYNVLARYSYPSELSFESLLQLNGYGKYMVLFLWALLLSFAMYAKNINIFCFGGIILSWIEYFFLFNFIMVEASVFKTIILFMVYYIARRKEELG